MGTERSCRPPRPHRHQARRAGEVRTDHQGRRQAGRRNQEGGGEAGDRSEEGRGEDGNGSEEGRGEDGNGSEEGRGEDGEGHQEGGGEEGHGSEQGDGSHADEDRQGHGTSGRRAAQDALSLLTRDHREVDALFHRFEATGPRAQKERADLVGRIIEALSVHAALEETVFYPAVRAEVEAQNDQVLEALEEHHVVKWTLSELEDLDPDDERYAAKVTVLIESVRHHVDEEEHELFPAVRSRTAPATTA